LQARVYFQTPGGGEKKDITKKGLLNDYRQDENKWNEGARLTVGELHSNQPRERIDKRSWP